MVRTMSHCNCPMQYILIKRMTIDCDGPMWLKRQQNDRNEGKRSMAPVASLAGRASLVSWQLAPLITILGNTPEVNSRDKQGCTRQGRYMLACVFIIFLLYFLLHLCRSVQCCICWFIDVCNDNNAPARSTNLCNTSLLRIS